MDQILVRTNYFMLHNIRASKVISKLIVPIFFFKNRFLLSEHTLCKESIEIVKKFDFEILMYLYVLRPPEFIYAIFGVMCACRVCE